MFDIWGLQPSIVTLAGGNLPMRGEEEILHALIEQNQDFSTDEPEIAANIGQQMLHMDLPLLSRDARSRIRDIAARVTPENAVLVGGGIGHLAAWLLDAWVAPDSKRPSSFRIIEEGGKFGVILDRLIRRYSAESWTSVLSRPWNEVVAETTAWNAASATPENSVISPIPLPSPTGMVIIDVPELQRPASLQLAFEIVKRDGIIMVIEPEVPTGDVGNFEPGNPLTEAQKRVEAFNSWISAIRESQKRGFKSAFVELSGATLVVLIGC